MLKIDPTERKRLQKLTLFEKAAHKKGFRCIAGIDEAGRGPLAGPVVAAACIIPHGLLIPGVDDSKKLDPKKRCALFEQLTNDPRIQYGVGVIDWLEIDRINILQATIKAMLEAVLNLPSIPDLMLVDGMLLAHPTVPSEKIIQGDAKSQSIAAASIIAKETRDRLMVQYHQEWPIYQFEKHKGYATQQHRDLIAKYGLCPIHRRSFNRTP